MIDYFLTLRKRSLDFFPPEKVIRLVPVFRSVPTTQSRIGNYELLQVVGRGGFSKVLTVRQLHTGKLFAMKIMLKE